MSCGCSICMVYPLNVLLGSCHPTPSWQPANGPLTACTVGGWGCTRPVHQNSSGGPALAAQQTLSGDANSSLTLTLILTLTSLPLLVCHPRHPNQPCTLSIQVCDYLMEGDTAEAAAEQGRLLLGLSTLQASQVTAVEAPALLQLPAKKGAAASGGGAGGCGSAVMAAAAAGAAAAVGVALAYLNLGQ